MTKNNDLGLLVVRVSFGLLMLLHGIAKLQHGTGFIADLLSSFGLPSGIAYGVYIGEIIAPLMLILGYKTRIATLIIAFTMVVAGYLVHSADFFSLSETGGWALELVGLFFFGTLALFFTGGGRYSISNKNTWD